MLLQPWWERDPSLLAEEISGLERSGFRVRQQPPVLGQLELLVTAGASQYTLQYPHAFPGEAVRISDGALNDPLTRVHWAYGPIPFAANGIDELRHDRPHAYQRAQLLFSVLAPPELSKVRGDGGELTFGAGASSTLVLLGLTGSTLAWQIRLFAAPLGAAFPIPMRGWWVEGEPPDWSDATEVIVRQIEERIALFRGVSLARLRRGQASGEIVALAYRRPGSAETEWLFSARSTDGVTRLGALQAYRPEANISRAPFANRLVSRRVAIVGCGALGWSIAVSLARAGVGSFVLYDRDRVHAANLPRLGARLSSVGRLKVNALGAEIAQVQPGALVRAHPLEVGRQLGAPGIIADKPDLIVDATAESASPPETNLAAIASGAAALYAWSSPGVIAARVFRVVPGRTACYACVRSYGPAPIRAERRVDRPWTEEFTWNGANFNLEMVASAATRMAVRTLLGHAADTTNPDHLVLELGGPVPTVRAQSIPRDPQCEVCGG